MIVYIRSIDVDTQPGQRAVVVVVDHGATVVVHVASIGRLTQPGHGDIILYNIIYYMGHFTGIGYSTKMGYNILYYII